MNPLPMANSGAYTNGKNTVMLLDLSLGFGGANKNIE